MTEQVADFSPKKWPKQQRSRITFEALVEACARLLAQRGYVGVSTNHIAAEAGVGIASLYEYFPDKDAVVAQVADRLVGRVMGRLGGHMNDILSSAPRDGVRLWIDRIYETLADEKELVAVFMYQVPYTNRLPSVRRITPLLFRFSETARQQAGIELRQPRASLYLIINLVSSTILQLITDPPGDVTREELLRALAERVGEWLASR